MEKDEIIELLESLRLPEKPQVRKVAGFYEGQAITNEWASQVDWVKETDNFDLNTISELVENIGKSKKEKKIVIKAIYDAMEETGEMFKIPYSVDGLLNDLYKKYDESSSENTKALLQQIEYLKAQVEELKKENVSLKEQAEEKINKAEELDKKRVEEIDKWHALAIQSDAEVSMWHAKYIDAEREIEHLYIQLNYNSPNDSANDDDYKEKVKTLEDKVQLLQEKLGNKTVPLSVLAEGLKDYAEEVSIKEAHELFSHLNNLLITVPAWTKNAPMLKQFFRDINKNSAKPKIIMSGDYVVTKHVDNEVNSVAAGATGIVVTKDKQ